MKLTYLLQYPVLSGGNKVIFQHARLLRDLGHEVTILGDGPPPEWFDLGLPYRDHNGLSPDDLRRDLGPQDLVVATYWTTIPLAHRLGLAGPDGLGPLAHFCQGYEGDLAHLAPQRAAIEAAYREPLPTLVVSPHLADFLAERFGRESRVVRPVLDPAFRPSRRRWRPRTGRTSGGPWIAVPGIYEAPVKGVPTALDAVARLREDGIPARLLRFSPFPVTDEEDDRVSADHYLYAVPPEEVAEALRQADLLLFPSREGEGFGLPVLEAMASGVPVVASSIPSVEGFAGDAVERVPAGDAAAFAEAAGRLLRNPSLWRARRKAGIARAKELTADRVAPALEAAVTWARG